ncbi:MAG: DUF1080 domain-containing protein [Pseudomonadota bacterium]
MIEPTGVGRTAWRVARVAASAAVLALAGCGDTSAADDGGHMAGGGGAGAGSAALAGGGMLVSAGGDASSGKAGSLGGDGGIASTAGGMAGSSGSAASGGPAGNAGTSPFGGAGGAAGSAGFAGMLGGSGGAGGGTTKVTLFDGQNLALWKSRNGGGAAPWTVADSAFTVVPNSGDIETKEAFGDIQLHVEFWIPTTPTTNAEQDRGNSGVYLQGRYEVQVLDSYQHPLDGMNDCGAIYELKNADVNAALPPENWQTYEITFRAPRWSGQTKTESAKISVIWNGQQAQKDISVPAPTKLGDPEVPGDAPLRLQDHGHSVRYRNIWLQKL